MNIKKIILSILGVGFASAAGYEAITPADTTMSKVATAYEQSEPLKSKYALTNSQFVKAGADKNKVKTELGEAGSKDFEPSLTFSRWNGEAKFKIKPDISKVAKKDKKLKLDGEKIKYKAGKIDYVFYDMPEASEDGGFEWEIVLNEKPASNTFFTAIESTGVEFYKQLPLNEERQEDGITCTATECKDAEGNITASRPEDVVDSIAVYGTGKSGDFTAMGGMNYMAGKMEHINRIKAIDANGDWTWCDQDISGGIWTKTCPQSFLDSAAYPVVVDPTFGYTTAGGSDTTLWNKLKGSIFALSEDATLQSVTSYIGHYLNPKVIYGIYDSSLDLVEHATEVQLTSPSEWVLEWKTGTLNSSPSVSAGNFWLSINCNGNNSLIKYDSGATNQYFSEDYEYNSDLPSTIDLPSYVARKLSIYATYTASGGAARRVIITE